MADTHTGLKRALKLRDLILLNIVAVYTPSTLSQSLQLGKFGLLFWTLAVLAFMLPYGAALSELSLKHPREGGVYAWTRMAFGDFHGFVCGWCYWVNTFLYVPSIFLGMAAVIALFGETPGGAQTAWLNENQNAVVLIACLALWLSAGLHIVGLSQGKWLQNLGAFGRMAIALGLLAAGLWKLPELMAIPVADPTASILPSNELGVWHTLALWPFVLNALVGLDLGSAMSEEAAAPSRDIPRSLVLGGLVVGLCYLLTYGAVLITGVPENNVIYGHVQAINRVLTQAGLGVLASLVVLTELLGLLGSGAAWLAAPARVPFAIGLDSYLPKVFTRVHPRFGTPYVALLVQALTATALILINSYGASLQEAYLALLGGSIVLVLVTYAYLFAAWRRLSSGAQTGSPRVRWLSRVGMTATGLAIGACFIPPPVVAGIIGFELKIIGSVAVMLVCGLVLYLAGNRRQASGSAS
jgi:amino acid transporter